MPRSAIEPAPSATDRAFVAEAPLPSASAEPPTALALSPIAMLLAVGLLPVSPATERPPSASASCP
ncbi:hypothetical protein FV222_20305 [Methylobacterium sp. WL103]|nr:hypothetical protein FV226_02640 [Methylobacterium sp. WL12]TXM95679.1 hypothetical protein FV222_20305 [Methylobacterium sp. WL103]